MMMKYIAPITGLVLPLACASAQITHSANPLFVAPDGSVACQNNTGAGVQRTTDNSYVRSYDLGDPAFGPFVTPGFDLLITGVDFGVQRTTHPNLIQDITVNIYIDPAPAQPIVWSGLQLVASETISVIDGVETIELVTLATPVQVCGTDTIVVEIFSPDYSAFTQTAIFYMGTNTIGQTAPSFFRSVSCSVLDPVDVAGLGFPDAQWVTSVFGTEVPSTLCTPVCYADCDGNGILNILDFICFGDAFAVGCP